MPLGPGGPADRRAARHRRGGRRPSVAGTVRPLRGVAGTGRGGGAITPWNFPLHQIVGQDGPGPSPPAARSSSSPAKWLPSTPWCCSTPSRLSAFPPASPTSCSAPGPWSARPSPAIPASTSCPSPVPSGPGPGGGGRGPQRDPGGARARRQVPNVILPDAISSGPCPPGRPGLRQRRPGLHRAQPDARPRRPPR